jgi:hypothetical protein
VKSSADYEKPSGLSLKLQARGLTSKRNLFWSWYEPRNFGDWVGPYLYEALAGKVPLHCDARKEPIGKSCFYFAGSMLRRIGVADYAIVWGSGVIDSADPVKRPQKVLAVRGPRTMERLHELDIDCPERFGDPAVLLPDVYTPTSTTKRHRVGFVPHFVDLPAYRAAGAGTTGDMALIDVGQSVEAVVDQIAQCELTVSSSLHGLIVSHAYGVPSVWVDSIEPLQGDGVKFADYFESVDQFGVRSMVFDPAVIEQEALREQATLPSHDNVIRSLRETCPI